MQVVIGISNILKSVNLTIDNRDRQIRDVLN